MNIFRKKSLIEDVEPVFHVYRTPDSEVVGHPARTGHVLGILSSIAMRNGKSNIAATRRLYDLVARV